MPYWMGDCCNCNKSTLSPIQHSTGSWQLASGNATNPDILPLLVLWCWTKGVVAHSRKHLETPWNLAASAFERIDLFSRREIWWSRQRPDVIVHRPTPGQWPRSDAPQSAIGKYLTPRSSFLEPNDHSCHPQIMHKDYNLC